MCNSTSEPLELETTGLKITRPSKLKLNVDFNTHQNRNSHQGTSQVYSWKYLKALMCVNSVHTEARGTPGVLWLLSQSLETLTELRERLAASKAGRSSLPLPPFFSHHCWELHFGMTGLLQEAKCIRPHSTSWVSWIWAQVVTLLQQALFHSESSPLSEWIL